MNPAPQNEPVLAYAPGSPERAALRVELARQSGAVVQVPMRIGDDSLFTDDGAAIRAPHRHALVLATHPLARPEDVRRAVQAAERARPDWAALPQAARSRIFQRAAELLAGPWRQRLNAATMLGQSKTPREAEIDAACELADFFRFNAWFAERLMDEQPSSPPGARNWLEARPLDGFVYAVTPFNFTAIAGNLPAAPALLGNTVVWKPSPLAVLSAHHVMELLREAGLPPGVVNLVIGDAELVTTEVLESREFGGLHFTGSGSVFRSLWQRIAEGLPRYRCYPRIVGEAGGKDFVLAHPSADLEALTVALVRGAFEYQGQKCSAASRAYVPRSLWPRLEERLRAVIAELTVGDPTDFRSFLGAVIGRAAWERVRRCQELAATDAGCRVVAGGGGSDAEGWFVDPTVVEVGDPRHALLREEIFGPILSVFVYEDARLDEAVALVDEADLALTGAIFAEDRLALERLAGRLRGAAGNLYLNDKPTGAVVGQQPFGGGRLSGTNDKAGSAWNLTRWVSPRAVKETFVSPRDWRYPYLVPGD
ncbi:MAG: L-glutamate gamma-semialdehyde dehydrogenase [Polyangiaceae bacterium]|nr:L-glutamate gamma-semialdehyde dehydrogenase [Polyangiaceae bacterium]